jgi:hypothetical protein
MAPQAQWRREANPMIRFVLAVLMSVVLLGGVAPAEAKPKQSQYQTAAQDDGYTIRRRRGGYSYSYADSVNTYGTYRRRQIGPPSFREQTISGPFDNSFFFDSGIGLHGGDSPYMH